MPADRGSRAWMFTVNNPTPGDFEQLKALEVDALKYIVYGKEVGEKGTPHLQGYLYLRNAKTMSALSKLCKRASLEVPGGPPKANRRYCCKGSQSHEEYNEHGEAGPRYGIDADIYEWGTIPLADKEKGELAKDRAKRNLALCVEGRIEDMDADIVATQLRNYQYGASELKRCKMERDVQPLAERNNEWHYGVTHCGKTTYATEQCGPIYDHPLNNTNWDGYDYEPTVVFQDVDKASFAPLQRFVKTWFDRQVVQVKILYGFKRVRPKRMIVTSNDHPSQIWPPGRHLDAILDRFKIFHWTKRYGEEGWSRPEGVPLPVADENEINEGSQEEGPLPG